MKVYILYNEKTDNEIEINAVNAIEAELLNNEVEVILSGTGESEKEAINSCNSMIIVANDPETMEGRILTDRYKYYLNEITWGRKTDGLIVLALGEGFAKNRIPYKFKNCKTFKIDDTSAISEFVIDGELGEAEKSWIQPMNTISKINGDTSKDIKPEKSKESKACKDDHVFSDYPDLPDNKYDSSNNFNKAVKPQSKGCIVGFIILFVVLFTLVPILISLINKLTGGSLGCSVTEKILPFVEKLRIMF